MVQLRALFPGVPEPVALSVVRASRDADVVVLRGRVPTSVPVLPLERTGQLAIPGRSVIVLGHPGGLELLLARVDPAVLRALIGPDATALGDTTVPVPALLERLNRLGQIRAYATWGHLADTRPHQLAHDAATSIGGSGGPIFATSGRVIGISTAVVTGLDGAALGTPIRSALALLDSARRPAARRPGPSGASTPSLAPGPSR